MEIAAAEFVRQLVARSTLERLALLRRQILDEKPLQFLLTHGRRQPATEQRDLDPLSYQRLLFGRCRLRVKLLLGLDRQLLDQRIDLFRRRLGQPLRACAPATGFPRS